ncbi:hypothetical protein D3C72_1410380 [compost metagenome]
MVKMRPSEAPTSSLSVVKVGTRKARLSPSLNFSSDGSSTLPLAARIQPRSDRMTVMASRGMKASGATKAEASTASPMVVRRGEISALRTTSSSLEMAFHCLPSEDVSAFSAASSSDRALNSFSIAISSIRAS